MVEIDNETGIRHVQVKPYCRCMHAPQTTVRFPVRWRDDEYTLLDDPEAERAAHSCEFTPPLP